MSSSTALFVFYLDSNRLGYLPGQRPEFPNHRLDGCNVLSLKALGALLYFKLDGLPFI
jgi:hypothetical protein